MSVRREALLALQREGDPVASETAARWLTAGEGLGTRDLAIAVLVAAEGRGWIDAVRVRLDDGDEATVIAAIQALARWRDTASIPALHRLAEAPRLRVRRAARAALAALAA